MKFHSLEATNFLTIGHFRVGLDDRGLHVIQGENTMDTSAISNGAGKSSMVDALSWVIYGTTARGVKGDAVINRAAKKNTKVTLIASRGASVYEITRYRKHKDHKNALHVLLQGGHGESAVLTKGTDAETQQELERILGCSKEVFLASVYAGQERMPDLPSMTDRELKSLVEEAAGLQRIEAAYLEARQRANQAAATCSELQVRHDAQKVTVARTVGNIEHSTLMSQQWEEGREKRRAELQATADQARRQHSEASTKYEAASANKERLTAMLEETRKGLDGHGAATAAAKEARQLANNASLLVGQLQFAFNQHLSNAKAHQAQMQQAAAGEMDGKPCVTCGAPPDPAKAQAHRQHMIDKARTDAHAEARKAQEIKAQLDDAIAKGQQAAEHAAQLEAAIPDVTEATERIAKIQGALETIRTMADTLNGAKNVLAMIESSLDIFNGETNPHLAEIARLNAQLEKDREAYDATVKAHEEALQKHRVLESVVKLYGPSGVRAQILDTVTPYLNERTADYLSTLSDGNLTAVWSTLSRTSAGAVREKFTIDVTHAKGGEDFASISGGEKRKVRLACALALQDLVTSRVSEPMDLFIGDEIDDALDPAGLERLMTILERKARERGTVLVISHNSLTDWCDNITTVAKVAEHTSTVSGSLCI